MTCAILTAGGPADLDKVMTVMDDAFDPAFGEAWTRSQCAGILALPGVWLTLARVEGAPIGFTLGRIVLDEAELLLLAVRPSSRRRGAGDALLREMLDMAARRGAARVHLEMRDGNSALALYRRAGFAATGRRRNYYFGRGGRLFDALTLSLDLPKREQLK